MLLVIFAILFIAALGFAAQWYSWKRRYYIHGAEYFREKSYIYAYLSIACGIFGIIIFIIYINI
jgi:hypothetical protein